MKENAGANFQYEVKTIVICWIQRVTNYLLSHEVFIRSSAIGNADTEKKTRFSQVSIREMGRS